MRRKPGLILLSVTASLFAGCSSAPDDASPADVSITDAVTLTTLPPGAVATSSVATTASEVPVGGTTTSTSAGPTGPPRYEVVARTNSDVGDTVIVLLDPTSYTSLSDIDLQGIITDVYDRFPPVFEAHVVDDPAAVDRIAREGPAALELSTLADHYLARLEEGFRIVYLGRFKEYGTSTLGS